MDVLGRGGCGCGDESGGKGVGVAGVATIILGFQSNGIVGTIISPGIRGTMSPLSSKKNVCPVTTSGPMQTPTSFFSSNLACVSFCLAFLIRLSSGESTIEQEPKGNGNGWECECKTNSLGV
jgi:hypothetical protein